MFFFEFFAAIQLAFAIGVAPHVAGGQSGFDVDADFAAVAAADRELVVIGSVCGTEGDPQGLERQREILRASGVILCPTNASAARLALAYVGNNSSSSANASRESK